MFFVQTSTLPSSMHQKLAEHGLFFIQINQLQTRSNLELEDDSTVYMDREAMRSSGPVVMQQELIITLVAPINLDVVGICVPRGE